MLSKTALENLYIQLSTNSTTENRQLGLQLMNLNQRLLLQKYFNNETSITLPTIAGQQDYKLPQNYSKMKSVTTTIGTITYTLKEVQTIQEWNVLNQYKWDSQIPWYYFIYNGYVKIFPVPSGSGNTITYDYKLRVTDLSIDDVTSGTVTIGAGAIGNFSQSGSGSGYSTASNVATTGGSGTGCTVDITTFGGQVTGIVINNPGSNYEQLDELFISGGDGLARFIVTEVAGSNVIIGTSTNWDPTVGINETRWIQIPFPDGDNQWYQVASVDSPTQITLYNSYQGTAAVTNAPYTLGQMPILTEDFQEMLVWSALAQYYSSGINKNLDTAAKWEAKYNSQKELLDAYLGSKSTGVALEGDIPLLNSNLYYMG